MPQFGELRVQANSIHESTFILAVRSVIHDNHKTELISAMEQLRDAPEQQSEIWGALSEQLEKRRYEFARGVFTALASDDLTWAIETAQEASTTDEDWRHRREEIAKLSNGDSEELAAFWKSNGCGCVDSYRRAPHIDSPYNLALFGIESPGGFQSWDAAKGSAQRHNWLPEQRLHVAVDTYGTFSPEPAASRLFVPDERGDAVRGTVTLAFLRHAKSLALEHSGSKEWLEWFGAFLESWEDASSGRSPSHVREFTEELKSEPALPDVPNGLWVGAAATHSAFGKIVLARHLGGYGPYLDVTQPVGREHIEKAAAKADVAPDQIDATVESLSDYLGWNITKGLGDTAP